MIDSLHLVSFRSYEDARFVFRPVTLIVGNNGAGKTNLLEAISMLSLTTSWRVERDSEVIMWDKPFCRIESEDRELVVQRTPYMKRYLLNGVSKRTRDVVGQLPSVLFQPDDMHLLYGSPQYRRQYLDRLLVQVSLPYAEALHSLVRILKQRNSLLKLLREGQGDQMELEVWDERLSSVRNVMEDERLQFMRVARERVPVIFQEILGDYAPLQVDFVASPPHTADFQAHLRQNRYKEIAAGVSLYGPQREDIRFLWNGHPVQESLSRGQARSLVIALKIAEIEYLDSHNENKPILLLDDVFSELDLIRQRHLLDFIGAYQTFITSTESELLSEAHSVKDQEIIKIG